MKFERFSKKQLTVLSWWCNNSSLKDYDAIICDGAVRSGKTFCMSLSFVLWAFYSFSGQHFGICGKTVTSLRRNLIMPLIQALTVLGFHCDLKISQNLLTVKHGSKENTFYLFGGKDESSAALIQGVTLAGILLDEVALMPRSFVEQALARCSVRGSRFWFNCNPENPSHWFYNEWIKKSKQKNALYLHFKMKDNPSLSAKIIKRYSALYSGTFFKRFVEGKWVAAEGLVYPMFSEKDIAQVPDGPFSEYYISCDYGTVNPASFGLWGLKDNVYYRIDEYYYSSKISGAQLTDEEYYKELERLAGNRKIKTVVVDPSAASFIACIRRYGKFSCTPAKNNVLDGIRKVCDALKSKQIVICAPCRDSVREFGLYRWEDSAAKDAPRKENDHAMDDIRYFVSTILGNQENHSFFAFSAVRK